MLGDDPEDVPVESVRHRCDPWLSALTSYGFDKRGAATPDTGAQRCSHHAIY
jgi:hypothetical protein